MNVNVSSHSRNVLIINGPNLNLVGKREKGIYGAESFESFIPKLRASFPFLVVDYFQDNIEGHLIGKLHESEGRYDIVLLNAGGYTHTSVALGDAVAAIGTPVIEIHISNILTRESFRHHSFLTRPCVGMVSGFGLHSYHVAIEQYLHMIDHPASSLA